LERNQLCGAPKCVGSANVSYVLQYVSYSFSANITVDYHNGKFSETWFKENCASRRWTLADYFSVIMYWPIIRYRSSGEALFGGGRSFDE